MEGLKALFGSKKFWLTVIGSALTAGFGYAGVDQHIIYVVATLFGINIGAQGLADKK